MIWILMRIEIVFKLLTSKKSSKNFKLL